MPNNSHVAPDSQPHPITLDAKTNPCPCVKEHHPSVTRTQNHHVLPQYAGGQNNHPGQPGYTPMQALCPTSHSEVHILLEVWAAKEALTPGVDFIPPATGHENHVIHVVALRGWTLFKESWPHLPFPRENQPFTPT